MTLWQTLDCQNNLKINLLHVIEIVHIIHENQSATQMSWKLLHNYCVSSHRICHMNIVYCHIEAVMWILPIVTS